ncbi:MFS transporter [Micromonospora sp. DT47]|uniref:MFS transporter n=1 Tax=Micromonospora sp. DT47 TaxID=3393431 RepID=UPI003CFA9034
MLAITTFVVVTTAMLPVGMLTLISDALRVEQSRVGLLVTVCAFTVGLTAAPLTARTSGWPRKRLFVVVCAVFTLGAVLSGLAVNYPMLVVARFLCGTAHGVFWSIVAGYAAALAEPGRTGRAMAIVSRGTRRPSSWVVGARKGTQARIQPSHPGHAINRPLQHGPRNAYVDQSSTHVPTSFSGTSAGSTQSSVATLCPISKHLAVDRRAPSKQTATVRRTTLERSTMSRRWYRPCVRAVRACDVRGNLMRKGLRRGTIVAVATAASLVFAASPASAHFCFKTNLNEMAAKGMAGSANWVSFGDVAESFLPGLCEEGIQLLARAGGVTTDTLINTHGTMAGGTLRKGADAGTPSISHLNFEALDAAIPDAYTACGMPVPEDL